MLKKWIVPVSMASLMLIAGSALSQGFTASPVERAPPAQRGPYEVISEAALGSSGLILFRPANLDAFPQRDTLPVMVWGNGGCAKTSQTYVSYLTTIASHGFLVLTTTVVEGESLGPPAVVQGRVQVPPAALRAALDWAEAEARREGSPLRGKIATDSMAAMGQSCGGLVAIALGTDPRIDTIGVFNAGVGPARANTPPSPMPTIDTLANLHGAVLLVNGHETDPVMADSIASFQAIDRVPTFYGARHGAGHLGTIHHPGGGEFADVASNWLLWILKGDREAGAMFFGENCRLCANPNWDVRSKRLR